MIDVQALKTQLGQLETEIFQQESRLNGARRTERDKRTTKQKMPAFQQTLTELDQSLETFSKHPKQYGFKPAEAPGLISRINSLRSKLEAMDKICSKEPDSRSALLGSGAYGSNHYKDTEETADLNNQQLYSKLQEAQQKDDEDLDRINENLGTLLQIEQDQNRKLRHHNELIDTIHEKLDVTDQDLKTNVKHTDIIAENTAGGWASLFVSIILLVAIILALFTNVLCPICIGGNGKC